MPAHGGEHHRGVRLATYAIPWAAINLSAPERAVYESLIAAPPNPEHAYVSASAAIYRMLPGAMAAAPIADRPERHHNRTLFFLPVSPWHLCFASEEARRHARIRWRPGQPGLPPVERIMDPVRYSSRTRMRSVHTYPRTLTFNSTTHTCAAYERALRWTFEQPTWQAAPERHLWVYEFPHVLRGALRTEVRMRGCAESVHAKMALGILLAQEDRAYDWRSARAHRHLFLIPFYSPEFFKFDEAAASPAEYKDVLAGESSGHGVSCHRFDSGRAPGAWSCADPALRNANGVRNAVRVAVAALEASAVLSPSNRAEHYAESFLRRKAALYNRSTFCVVPPGDSLITPRISSFVAALCVPVFAIETEHLPFQRIVPWANASLSVSPGELLAYHAAHHKMVAREKLLNASGGNESAAGPPVVIPPNPLAFLGTMPRAEVARIQRALVAARPHLLYGASPPSAVHSLAREIEAAFGGRAARPDGPASAEAEPSSADAPSQQLSDWSPDGSGASGTAAAPTEDVTAVRIPACSMRGG